MKISTLGTTRIDFNIYKPLSNGIFSEVKLDKFDFKIGGSVYHTSLLLHFLKTDICYYTLIGNDDLSILSRTALIDSGLEYKVSSNQDSKSPVTFIHLDNAGEKMMFSFDGNTATDDVIDLLLDEKDDYDAFYTSCYEINKNNYLKISNLINDYSVQNKNTFIDLSPLVHDIPLSIWKNVIPNLKFLLGTESEFKTLIEILRLENVNDLVKIYKLEKLYIKKGELGCTVINSSGSGRDFETTPVKSDNLTGCGDAFNTGVIFGELNNWELDKIAMYAMGLAYKVAKYGFIPNKII